MYGKYILNAKKAKYTFDIDYNLYPIDNPSIFSSESGLCGDHIFCGNKLMYIQAYIN